MTISLDLTFVRGEEWIMEYCLGWKVYALPTSNQIVSPSRILPSPAPSKVSRILSDPGSERARESVVGLIA